MSIIYYDSAIQINDKKDIVFFEKGFSNFIMGNSIEALKNLNRAIQLNPNNAKYYVNRGTIKYDLGDKESACNDWYNAMRIDYEIINYNMIQSNYNESFLLKSPLFIALINLTHAKGLSKGFDGS